MTYEYAVVINGGKRKYECFDAFARVSDSFTLCDGANSCKNSGKLAKKLASLFSKKISSIAMKKVDREREISKIVLDIHENCALNNEAGASTLLGLNILKDSYEIISVGDSYGKVFTRNPDGEWTEHCSIPRDLDYNGNPWQLIGSDVCELVHYTRLYRENVACVFLMSDGVGDFIKNSDIEKILNKKDIKKFNPSNLRKIVESLLSISGERGSKDDMSICMAFIEKKNEG